MQGYRGETFQLTVVMWIVSWVLSVLSYVLGNWTTEISLDGQIVFFFKGIGRLKHWSIYSYWMVCLCRCMDVGLWMWMCDIFRSKHCMTEAFGELPLWYWTRYVDISCFSWQRAEQGCLCYAWWCWLCTFIFLFLCMCPFFRYYNTCTYVLLDKVSENQCIFGLDFLFLFPVFVVWKIDM